MTTDTDEGYERLRAEVQPIVDVAIPHDVPKDGDWGKRVARAAMLVVAQEVECALREGAEAIRLTREYVGEELLPNVDGWSHYELTKKAATAEALVERLKGEQG